MSPDHITHSAIERFCNRYPRASTALLVASVLALQVLGALLDGVSP